MKINYVPELPTDFTYVTPHEFDEYDLEDLYKLNLDEIWYWYGSAIYEGSGQILMRKGDLYDLHDAGHCSCYGPTERVEFNGQSLKALKASLSGEYYEEEAAPLFELAELAAA